MSGQNKYSGKGKTAVITGASSGFGREFAKLFAADGYDLVITARPGHKIDLVGKEMEESYGVKAYCLEIDLSSANAAAKLYDWVKGRGLKIDCLVNNAGIGNYGRFADNDLAREHELLELNVVALSELCHHFIPDMVAAGGGRILNVASIAGLQAGAYYATYFASKAYVLLFSEALALEYRSKNITVTALCPGVAKTKFFDRAKMSSKSWLLRTYLQDANYVAKVGYKAMMRGVTVVVPGLRNKVVGQSYRWLPRSVIARITKHLVEIAGNG